MHPKNSISNCPPSPKSINEPKQIALESNELGHELELLLQSVQDLYEKLNPVMSNRPVPGGMAKEPESDLCLLASDFKSKRCRVEVIRGIVSNIHSTLEL